MKLVQFAYKSNPDNLRLGYVDGCCVVDVNKYEKHVPNNMLDFVKNEKNLRVLTELKRKYQCCTTCLHDVIIKAPIHGMDKILCVGHNFYEMHNTEKRKNGVNGFPLFSSKFPSNIIGPNESLKIRPKIAKKVDWEAELCIIIGKKASSVKAENAYNYVFGYTTALDISGRNLEKENGGELLLSKAMDTFCPIGPCIVTQDDIPEPENLEIKCYINGVLKQNTNTSSTPYKIPQIIERVSEVMTLLPGDLILTGSHGGFATHVTPSSFLNIGDVIRGEIEKIGFIEIPVEKYVKPDDYYDYKLQNRCWESY